jgi:DNA (cytosine-5)-methyltransferase 1
MGFPDEYRIVVSDTQAYKQYGNSVAVPVVNSIAMRIWDVLKKVEKSQIKQVHTRRTELSP